MEIVILRRDIFVILLLSCFLMLPKPGNVNALAKTDPSEVTALNRILGRWERKANSNWNISGEPCSGWAIDDTDLDNNPDFNPGIKCDCSYNSNKTCHIYKLRVYALSVVGPIPDELQNLTYLTNLNLDQNYLTGPIPPFIGNLTSLMFLTFGINALSGPLPKEIGDLRNLLLLALGTNKFSGQIPDEFAKLTNLQQLYIDSSGLSGELPAALSNLKNLKILWASDNNFTGKIPDYVGTWTNMRDLRFEGNSFEGPIPESFSNLVNITNLRIGDLTTGGSTLGFVSSLASLANLVLRNCKISDTLPSDFRSFKNLQLMDLSFNNITGHLPQSLFTLDSLKFLFLGNNSIVGDLPANISINLTVDLSYNQLSGNFPPWYNQQSTKVNLVANNFYVSEQKSSNILQLGLNCLQRDFSCYGDSPIYSNLAIKCGGSHTIAAGNLVYQEDSANMSSASYYMSINGQWALSNAGLFAFATDSTNFIRTNVNATFHDELNTQLYQTARMSPSLRYYGLGLENRDYTVKLHFAEILYTDPDQHMWQSLGRRLFDIYIQGILREKDFNIVDETGGRTLTPVVKNYTITVTNNFLEIHLIWAGKGTCCIPKQGTYGPLISAISITPHIVGSKLKTKNTGLIVGIVAGIVFGLLGVMGIIIWIHMKQKREVDEELLGMLDKPNVFGYSELRSATESFSQSNILGEGGYGAVYKGKLLDGQLVAVKQLASKTHHGKRQFVAEIETISAVQHRNLVKLHGCCIEGSTPLLIYEYMENGSLDQAIFGKNSLYLDWETRYDICLGIARGLAYLHHESSVRIVHRDIKSSNILLDSELKPKISDFGLAKFFDDGKTHISTRLAGTIGYLAPEYAMTGYLTEKTDVFAFGVVVLETVSGRPNSDSMVDQDKQFLLEWAWTLYEKECMLNLIDKKLQSFDEEQVLKLTAIALLCIQASPSNRPSMSRVVSMMTGDSEIDKPASRPAYLTEWQLKELTNSDISEVSILREGR